MLSFVQLNFIDDANFIMYYAASNLKVIYSHQLVRASVYIVFLYLIINNIDSKLFIPGNPIQSALFVVIKKSKFIPYRAVIYLAVLESLQFEAIYIRHQETTIARSCFYIMYMSFYIYFYNNTMMYDDMMMIYYIYFYLILITNFTVIYQAYDKRKL